MKSRWFFCLPEELAVGIKDSQDDDIVGLSMINDGKWNTWYVRDAQGNLMHTYTARGDTSAADVTDADKLSRLSSFDLLLGESSIYGSSRLAMLNQNTAAEVNYGSSLHFLGRGSKFYDMRSIRQHKKSN